MPIILTRHGMVDTRTLMLDGYGRNYAESLPGILTRQIPNLITGKRIGGFYADPDPALTDPNYKRCFETIEPLAALADYSIDAIDGNGVDALAGIVSFFNSPDQFGVLCLRYENGINPLREKFQLADWDSGCAYKYLAILTSDATKPGGGRWRNIPTNQPSDGVNCPPN
jgi:hypothetical protein